MAFPQEGTAAHRLMMEKVKKDSASILMVALKLEDDSYGYAYIAVLTGRVEEFIKTYHSGKGFKLKEYGEVLAAGEGFPAPKEVQQKMTEEYGFNHEKAAVLFPKNAVKL